MMESIRQLAEQYLDHALEGLKNKNYSQFSKYFSEEMKQNLPEEVFLNESLKANQMYGPLKKRKYLTQLIKQDCIVFCWHGYFEYEEGLIIMEMLEGEEAPLIQAFIYH